MVNDDALQSVFADLEGISLRQQPCFLPRRNDTEGSAFDNSGMAPLPNI